MNTKYILMCTIVILFSCTACGCWSAIPFVGKNTINQKVPIGGTHSNSKSDMKINMPEWKGNLSALESAMANKIILEGIALIKEKESAAKVKEAEIKADKAAKAEEIAGSTATKWKRYFYWAVGILGTLTILFPTVASILYRRLHKSFVQVRAGVNSYLHQADTDSAKQLKTELAKKQDERTERHVKRL